MKKTALLFLSLLYSLIGLCQLNSDTALLNQRIKKSGRLLESNVDSARTLILQNLDATYKKKYAYGYSKSNSQLANYYTLKGQNDSALLFTAKAIKFARTSKDTNHIILMYLQSARTFASLNNYPKAIEHCLVAQNFADKKKDNTCRIK